MLKKIKMRDAKRTMSFAPSTLDEEKRTVELEFSSDAEIDMGYGCIEILDHSRDAVDLSRINNGKAPLLLNHDRDEQIGVIEKAEIKNNKGIATVRFSKIGKGAEVFEDIKDGIRSQVSVGYRISKYQIDESNPKKNVYTAKRWMPYEISIVSIPADITVGIRSQDTDEEYEVEIINQNERSQNEDDMPAPVPTEPSKDDDKTRQVHVGNNNADELLKIERQRVAEINDLSQRHKIDAEISKRWIQDGQNINEIRALVLEHISTTPTPINSNIRQDGAIGNEFKLDEKEVRQYSLCRAIHALATNDWSGAGFERDVSKELARSMNKNPEGILIPINQVGGKRDLNTITGSSGGYLVGQEYRPQEFIELLRNKIKVAGLGARILSGLIGDIVIPKMNGGATSQWIQENQEVTASDANFGQIKMSPKEVATRCHVSKKLIMQGTPDAENLVKDDMTLSLAIAIDKAVLIGSGVAGEPMGIKGTAGVGTATISGGNPSFANIVELETDVATANADVGNLAYLMSSADRGILKTKEQASNTAQFIWKGDNTVNGYKAEVTNQLAINNIFFGNWADIIIGQWGVIDLTVDPYTLAEKGIIRLISRQAIDIAIRHAESFSYTVTS
jgi:HK97 family phage major capsid protein/HK97 family phage prohead protease